MAKAVIIAHQSELIRKGLLSILENEILARIICIHSLSEFKKTLFLTYTELVFILPTDCDSTHLLETIHGKSNNIFLVGICANNNCEYSTDFDFVLKLNDSTKELQEQIRTFLSEENAQKEDDELTSREKDVLKLIALGHTNRSIADSLFISTHTVISHRKNITDKLGIKSISGLTVYALLQKIISQNDIANEQVG